MFDGVLVIEVGGYTTWRQTVDLMIISSQAHLLEAGPWVEQIVLDHGRVRGVLSEVEAFGPGSGPVLGPVGVRRVEHGRIYL